MFAHTHRLEICTEDGVERINLKAVHYKLDRRTWDTIDYKVPLGELHDMLLLYINEGHPVLEEEWGSQHFMFMNHGGNDFLEKKSTFPYYWTNVLKGKWLNPAMPFKQHFPAVKGRNMYIRFVTANTGEHAKELHEGIAHAMGQMGTKHWGMHYAPGNKNRMAQLAADNHHVLRRGNNGASTSAAPPTAHVVHAAPAMPAVRAAPTAHAVRATSAVPAVRAARAATASALPRAIRAGAAPMHARATGVQPRPVVCPSAAITSQGADGVGVQIDLAIDVPVATEAPTSKVPPPPTPARACGTTTGQASQHAMRASATGGGDEGVVDLSGDE